MTKSWRWRSEVEPGKKVRMGKVV